MSISNTTIEVYAKENGKIPFSEWIESLDKMNANRILGRIRRLGEGHLGDAKRIEEIFEARFMFGSGYRVYFAFSGKTILVLLCGGDKKTQKSDIATAKRYWKNWNERK